jgi:hypothetical protein
MVMSYLHHCSMCMIREVGMQGGESAPQCPQHFLLQYITCFAFCQMLQCQKCRHGIHAMFAGSKHPVDQQSSGMLVLVLNTP